MAVFFQPNISSDHFLDEEESRHCIKALRYKTGNKIKVIDGNGGLYEAIITTAHHKKCEFRILDSSFIEPDPFYIHVAIAPTKNIDRLEWFVEKAVEIGIQEISFLICANSERKFLKPDRLIRKAISALKQSGQTYLPKINEPVTYSNFIKTGIADEKYIAFVDPNNPTRLSQIALPGKAYCVLIGPEGDFNTEELHDAEHRGFKKVSLGDSTLRTETAGLIACHTLNLINLA